MPKKTIFLLNHFWLRFEKKIFCAIFFKLTIVGGCRNQYCVFQVIGCPFWSFPSTFSFSLATSGCCCQNLLKIWGYMNNLDNRGRANSTKFKPPCKMCGQLGQVPQPLLASLNGWDTCPALLCYSTSYIWIRPYFPKLQQRPATGQAYFPPKKCK